jgi:hypothetical protein
MASESENPVTTETTTTTTTIPQKKKRQRHNKLRKETELMLEPDETWDGTLVDPQVTELTTTTHPFNRLRDTWLNQGSLKVQDYSLRRAETRVNLPMEERLAIARILLARFHAARSSNPGAAMQPELWNFKDALLGQKNSAKGIISGKYQLVPEEEQAKEYERESRCRQ